MLCGALGDNDGGDDRQILGRDPTAPFIAGGLAQLAIPKSQGGEDVLHEEVRMQMRPPDAAAFDVALRRLVPGKVRIGRPTIVENALIDDKAYACILCCVHERFALVKHGDGVTGQQKQPIDTFQGSRKSSCVIEIEIDRCLFAGSNLGDPNRCACKCLFVRPPSVPSQPQRHRQGRPACSA
jgi:hypothetical protein